MYAETDLLPISALQHLIYCPRQCALIHNEQLWVENRLTVEGQQLHEKADDPHKSQSRPGVRITCGLHLRSFAFGLRGIADVVEFPDIGAPVPIEYKRGRPKKHDADKVQLCAQALCLEEMLKLPDRTISCGEIFYGKTRRRQPVPFDGTLRQKTIETASRLHQLIASGQTPPARYEKQKCDRCSLITLCMPQALRARRSSADRFQETLNDAIEAP